MTTARVYLDWNATAPLRPEARDAMIAAMDLAGNPSSVHAEGRAARGLIERARAQVAQAVGAGDGDVIFVSGATEAAALVCAGRWLEAAAIEHDAVSVWTEPRLTVDCDGQVPVPVPSRSALQLANSETGILQRLPAGLALVDATQAFGKVPIGFDQMGCDAAIVSAHKLGGPKGIGAVILRRGIEIEPRIRGGGQEMGRRSGTENLTGIAGFGAAAEAALREVEAGRWSEVAELRNILENAIEDAATETIFVGKLAPRLPNTSCLIAPGWKGETQVMQMDLGGFAISAGSACSSGKVKESRVLRAMGFDAVPSRCAIRVSLGPETKERDVIRFARTWIAAHRKFRRRAA